MKLAVTTASFIPREMHGLVHIADTENAPHIYIRCYGDTLCTGWGDPPPGSTPTCMECVVTDGFGP